jgi:DNA-binding NarL/FixJ family response regulator
MEKTKKILVEIVDDDEILCTNISKFLVDNGCDCIVAHNGKEGLSLMNSQKPDVVLLDIKMPFMDGIDLLKVLSKDNPEMLSKIVLITNSQSSEYLADALELGIKEYFVKSDMSLQNILGLIKRKVA